MLRFRDLRTCDTSIFPVVVFFGLCLATQGSVQQQTGGDPAQSLRLTRGFAPTVSSVCTDTRGFYARHAGFHTL